MQKRLEIRAGKAEQLKCLYKGGVHRQRVR